MTIYSTVVDCVVKRKLFLFRGYYKIYHHALLGSVDSQVQPRATDLATVTTMQSPSNAKSSDPFDRVKHQVQHFYDEHSKRIKASHGLAHVLAVLHHTECAISCHQPTLSPDIATEIKIAALLHDVDDHKYFPNHQTHENARSIMERAQVSNASADSITYMIDLVSCSANGNSVPDDIVRIKSYHLLIPRWSDRLEAVGSIGVVRCYQYNQEHDQPLSSEHSPRAQTVNQVWDLATPDRFDQYQKRGGTSADMISHYYDKLLHVARPPNNIVRNKYLEEQAEQSAKELVEVCVRYGRTGMVDEEYIRKIAASLGL